jgi:hypothetical protein
MRAEPPRISVITRTLGRDCLAEAGASVAAQSLRPAEWVVVDAAGTGVAAPPAGDVPVRVVSTGRRLPRSRAANAGLDAARGDLLLILDDDDLILPGHRAHLAQALAANPDARLAYSDWEARVSEADRWGGHAPPFSHLLLCRQNLFAARRAVRRVARARAQSARRRGPRVLRGLGLLARRAQLTRFVHSPQCTAITGPTCRSPASPRPRGCRPAARGLATIRNYRDDRERLAPPACAHQRTVGRRARRLAASAAMWTSAHRRPVRS